MQKMSFRKEYKIAFVIFISWLLEKISLKYALTSGTGTEKLLQKPEESGWLSGPLAEKALHQYKTRVFVLLFP